ncbi:MAG: BamA/TamA family outer membrane protein [Candidatus Aminicenantes bacterium]|nr:BamA/TamA family outer membrane protein [Candidatus Aminicenantes bacterium]
MKTRPFLIAFWLLLLIFIFFFSEIHLNAQYYGRNKVQYKSFDYKVLKTEHFDVYFYPEMKYAAVQAARMAERWYARYSRLLRYDLEGRQPLILYASPTHFQQTTAIPGTISEGTGGVTELLKRRIVLPFGATLSATDHVIGHELVHAFQFDITSLGNSSYARMTSPVLRLPLWLIEGMAEYLSVGPVDPNTSMWMRDAVNKGDLPSIRKMRDPRFFPYRYGQSLWAYIAGRWGDRAVSRIMRSAARAGDYKSAIENSLKVDIHTLSRDWHSSLENTYKPLLNKTQVTLKSARSVIRGTDEIRLNVSPSISPEGKKVVYFSSKNLFSIEMYMADVKTGRIIRKFTSTALNPHFESLHFIKSAGSWDFQGQYFAFGAISKGKPVISIIRARTGRKKKELAFAQLDEILGPTWSPDGRYIAFSAQKGGTSDLYIYDLKKERLKRLTNDPYGDLQPAWSPDGKSIAFTTERFSTDLSVLSIGKLELALIDPVSREITRIIGFNGAQNLNPQWAEDSESLYFSSDQNGINNIYMMDLNSRDILQVTNVYTGVSGITGTSPAFSVARRHPLMAFCLYNEGAYSIYTKDLSSLKTEKKKAVDFGKIKPSLLPPRKEPEGEIIKLIQNPFYGLPKKTDYPVSDYKPRLKLDFISQPSVAIGADRFGLYTGGGVSLFFSDMLGYHNLSTIVQLNNRLIDSAGVLGYKNNRKRLHWGGVIQRIPYVTGGYALELGELNGEPVIREKQYIFRQINYQISGFAYYPFSKFFRIELSGGTRFIQYDSEVWTWTYSGLDGIRLGLDKEKIPTSPGLNLTFFQSALVHDSSNFGATSPVIGKNYVLKFSPYFGTIDFVNVIADYRQYLMPVRPFTLAFRFLHYGRYGKGAEDYRLYPIFIGFESFVRGYNTNSFSVQECGSEGDCFSFNQLFGSKIMVANVELRFPLFQILGIGKGYYGVFPVDFIAFFDSGVAWMEKEEDRAWFLGGERNLISSAGVGLRANLFNYFVLGLSYVTPFNRPAKSGYIQFTFMPGF